MIHVPASWDVAAARANFVGVPPLAEVAAVDPPPSMPPATVTLEPLASEAGRWRVRATVVMGDRTLRADFDFAPAAVRQVQEALRDDLPLYRFESSWDRGAVLEGLGSLIPDALDEASLRVTDPDGTTTYQRGGDYEVDAAWGKIGVLPGGRLAPGQPVRVSHRFALQRLDALILTAEGALAWLTGTDAAVGPQPPALPAGARLLGHVHVQGWGAALRAMDCYPVLTDRPAETVPSCIDSAASAALTGVLARLRAGQPLRILCWGDSVTEGSYLQTPAAGWPFQFAERLQRRFPQASIQIHVHGWPGYTTQAFLEAPVESPYHYPRTVLGLEPDLVVSEFVNDASVMNAEVWRATYDRIRMDFGSRGIPWVIFTPHYVHPTWMGLTGEQQVDDDPRPFVHFLRAFTQEHGIPLADAAKRYGQLWRQGIPYTTWMTNGVNHPDERGMALFAEVLMALFPAEDR